MSKQRTPAIRVVSSHHLTPNTTSPVVVDGNRLLITDLEISDAEIAALVAEREEADRAALVTQALRVGLICIRNAATMANVDYVEKEFARLMRQTDESHDKAAEVLDERLRATFADRDGQLPRTLEKFLGEKGTLRHLVDDLFDEDRRDSALGRMRTLLGGYFDGDGGVVARMLDPRREDSPLHGFRAEMRDGLRDLGDRMLKLEAGREARAEERLKGTAKGRDFEDEVEARLALIARGCGDVVERTGDLVGDSVRAKTGDFTLTINPAWTGGLTVRVALEAKSGRMGLPAICRELEAAKGNRSAAVAVVVFAAGCAPTGCAPFTLHGDHVICEMDAESGDSSALEMAVRLARALALMSARERAGDIDAAAVRRQLEAIRGLMNGVRGMKNKLTSVATVTTEISGALDAMRAGVLACVAGLEEEVAPAADVSPAPECP